MIRYILLLLFFIGFSQPQIWTKSFGGIFVYTPIDHQQPKCIFLNKVDLWVFVTSF